MGRLAIASPVSARLAIGLAALVAASWAALPAAAAVVSVEPAPTKAPAASRASPSAGESQLLPAAIAPWERRPAKPQGRPAAAEGSGSTQPATPPPSSDTASDEATQSPLVVVRWGFGDTLAAARSGRSPAAASPGRPLYFWLTLDGGSAAVERLRSESRLAITVHWTRADAGSTAGAPELTTELTVGRRGLAAAFAAQVERQGHFQWHSWTRKDALSPGRWTVSLTYPDGTPVLCREPAAQPCRFTIDVG